MINLTDGKSAMSVIAGIPKILSTLADKGDSVVEYTSTTRMEPITLIDSTIQTQPYVHDILQTLTTLFSGYMAQAIAITNSVNNISIASRLEQFNPKRDLAYVAKLNSFNQGLGSSIALEHAPLRLPKRRTGLESSYDVGRLQISTESKKAGNLADQLRPAENLAVGKIIEVTITEDKNSVTVPIQIRLMPMSIRPTPFVQAFSDQSYANTYKERIHRWREGELTTVGDMIFHNDLIDARRRNMMSDPSGFYRQMQKQRRDNKLVSLLSGRRSIANASTMAVISSETAAKLERELTIKLDNSTIRNKTIFTNSSLMLIAVVDEQWERVTIYHRGIDTHSEHSFRDIKNAQKGSGPNVEDILKSYLDATAPKL